MTWFRVGGAGIPAALKNAMNAVFNKKFGTSGQNYPPNQWPDEVNLMGPLPEGTASGSIANITDGADQVPIKLWNSNVDASVDGVSEVECKQTGKNIIQNLKYQATSNRVNIGQSDDDFSVFLRAGTYTLSISSSINIRAYYRGSLDGSNTLINPTYSTSYIGTFTLSEDKYVRIWVIGQDENVSTSDILTIQLEVGSTATAYEAYEAPTTYAVPLGRTIHGGSLELISGAGTDENGVNFTFDPISPIPETENVCNFWTNVGSSSIVYRRDIDLALQAVSSSRGLMMASRPVTQLVGEESDPDQVNELVENDETEQEGEDNAR